MIAGIKELKSARVGDTITLLNRPAREALPGFKEIKPQVFAGLYPVDANEYDQLRDALEKLQLNDSSLRFEPETSQALGFGFRCGFLGLLHLDIVQERLEREYDMHLITTAPTVVYQVQMHDGSLIEVENPSRLPDASKIEEIREPIITATILVPSDYVGPGDDLVHQQARRAEEHAVHGAPGDAHLGAAAQRSGDGLLRQAQIGEPRLCFARLRVQGVSRRPTWSSSTS